ncbi:SWIM zinc finger family protein [Halogranum rubrum]|uniref:Zinc finger SWIM domain protein n=1 Tax=Halogranum salarium B-1 TaxID=1210908 RepID=J2ZWI2_9EURY|nr:SWIM zinc finger family protein [Halogranum salarium]EJN57393.1 zinc finger SWIM domain protein [Halogranum salarium B-1]
MTNAFAHLDSTWRVVKRAQYEAFEFECCDGGIRVRNCSHAEPATHEYHVAVDDGIPVACECPADAKYSSACKHRVAVAIRTPLLDAVATQAVADGGTVVSDGNTAESDECDCADLGDGFPCWECYQTGKRTLPE